MLSLCLTNYNRYEMLLESFQHVYDDPRISEIVISDDNSEWKLWKKLEKYCATKSKISLFRNPHNVGMSLNKKLAIQHATNPWCIIFDSDNVLERNYLDAIPKHLDTGIFYLPSFAKPQFDYRAFSGITVDWRNVKQVLKKPMFEQCLNTCNMVVHRDSYVNIYQYDPNIKETDTLHMNYLWLKYGGKLQIVEGMEYFHRVGKHSGWLQNANYNIKKGQEQLNLIRQL
jgi:glycosyltransferase involved in cell wall biosynthesis